MTQRYDASFPACTSLVLPFTVEVWMGAKEEKLADRVLYGYAGQLRPLQLVGGACSVCALPVWIDRPSPMTVRFTSYTHFACQNGRWLMAQLERPKVNGIATALVAKRSLAGRPYEAKKP